MPDPAPTLEDIALATAATDGQTPTAVLDAFLPKKQTHLGQTLVPIRAGHELLLSQIGHPLAGGGDGKWEDIDVLTALFIFSRPSRELFAMVAEDRFEAEFFLFIDTIPTGDIPKLGSDMVAHWLKAKATALEMENPHATAQKKTADSAGGSTPLQQHASAMDGLRTWLSTIFRSSNSSP